MGFASVAVARLRQHHARKRTDVRGEQSKNCFDTTVLWPYEEIEFSTKLE